jgi:tetratricopeptide (TPR) repeat protein
MARMAAVIVILFSFAAAAGAQSPSGDSLEGLTSKAREAISQNAYESAVKLLTEAKTRFPASPQAVLALADLYYDKELYPLALSEYREAETRGATDFTTLTQISRCYGKLNQETKSIEYLTRILQEYPDNAETIDDLGWMYFKTHQLEKGEQVLLKGIQRLGMQRGIAMTLGTVYSGMNRYDKSKEFYMKSVNDAIRVGDRDFAAIAYYNLSLLEHNFFHFNSALRFTEESTAMEDRPSGHLARGELLQSRMDFSAAEQEYSDAYGRDTTPLSKVNLAILYQRFGRLDLARRYAEEVLQSRDLAWLANYGTDITRHFKDMHELLSSIYGGLAQEEAHRPTTGPFDRIAALVTSVRYRLVAGYHNQHFRLFSLKAGGQYLAQGNEENAWWEFYKGNEQYAEVALKYLGMARALETARTPHAASYYLAEEGKVRHAAGLLEQALPGFDAFWEREPTADALLSLIPLLQGEKHAQRRQKAIAELFGINPGALQQAGIGLPLSVVIDGSGWRWTERGLILRYLRRSGSECGPGMRYTLRITGEANGDVRWSAADSATAGIVGAAKVAAGGGPLSRSARIVKSILEELYSIH